MVNNESEFRVKVAVRVGLEETMIFIEDDEEYSLFLYWIRFDHFYHEKKIMKRRVVSQFIRKRIRSFSAIEKRSHMILFTVQKHNK